jgi:hypothetical protein
MTDLTDSESEAAIAVLPFLSSELRAEHIGQIVTWLYPQLQVWSYAWARQARDPQYRHREELVQEGAVTVLETLGQFARGERHQNVKSWIPYLYRTGQNGARTWMKSSTTQQLSGLTNRERRVARIPHSLSELRHRLEREPTAQELVEFHNAEMARRQVTPSRHGSLINRDEAALVLAR